MMNVLSNIIIRQMEKEIKLGASIKDNPILFRNFKQRLNNLYGIFFINYIKTKDSNIYTVMTKRKNSSYVYTYNITMDELILKGERINASA